MLKTENVFRKKRKNKGNVIWETREKRFGYLLILRMREKQLKEEVLMKESRESINDVKYNKDTKK